MTESKSTIKEKLKKIHSGGKVEEISDYIAIEEPLEIRVEYGKKENRQTANLTVTMRTPGCDEELATGFLFSEGIVENFDQINSISHIDTFTGFENVILVKLREDVDFNFKKIERHFYTSSSCGVCGKTSINAIKQIKKTKIKQDESLIVDKEIFYTLTHKLLNKQSIFENTGGLHASALFDCNGNLVTIKEDVGRHNALDKLLGYCLQKKLMPLNKYIILLSGRASFELIQKAALADAKIIASIGAPSSLAIQTAIEFEITYIGFLSNKKFNIYTCSHRIKA